jgi:hypothetical protein
LKAIKISPHYGGVCCTNEFFYSLSELESTFDFLGIIHLYLSCEAEYNQSNVCHPPEQQAFLAKFLRVEAQRIKTNSKMKVAYRNDIQKVLVDAEPKRSAHCNVLEQPVTPLGDFLGNLLWMVKNHPERL